SSDIAALRERVAAQSRTVEQLTAEQAKWSDAAHVEQQARERLKFVRVGDRSYTVIDPVPDASGAQGAPVVSAASVNGAAPWYGQLWQSVLVADQPSAGLTRGRAK
ncbi:MAG TPA: septum formation initiator family protein, partial [Candidatus Lustribacter sp.]|nr:septum formation initiator family protein [Candidatus Lustribacter sp.]